MVNPGLFEAFNFQPGYQLMVQSDKGEFETWEVLADVYNEMYIHSKEADSYAYFSNNGTVFNFNNFISHCNLH